MHCRAKAGILKTSLSEYLGSQRCPLQHGGHKPGSEEQDGAMQTPLPEPQVRQVPGTAALRWAHAAGSQPCSQGRQPDFKYTLNYSSRYSACWRHRGLDTGSLPGCTLTSLPTATATSHPEGEGSSSRGRLAGLCPLHRLPAAHSSATPCCQISLLVLSVAPCWLH